MTEIERKAKRLERGRYKNGIHEAILLRWVQVQLWNACGSSSVRRLTGGHNTRSDRSQDYNQEDTQGAAFCQQLVVSHPVRASLPLRAPERDPWTLLPAEGQSLKAQGQGPLHQHPLRQPHLSPPAFPLTFYSTCSKTKLGFPGTHPFHWTLKQKDAGRRDLFLLG